MNAAFLLLGCTLLFALAYLFYGRYLARLFEVDPQRETPAHRLADGVDYVATRPLVLFGHHFASIAGAGPIVGPIMAAYYGWGAVVLWILIGCIFVGAVHDFASMVMSVRNEGRTVAHVIEGQLGYAARQAFLLFAWAALVLVVAIFALLVAKTLVGRPAVATASLLFVAIAPCYGYLVSCRGVRTWVASLIFVPLLFLSVWLGVLFPFDLAAWVGGDALFAQRIWLVVLLVYACVASVAPVWVLLQPRDYLNSYLLYAMMVVGMLAVLVARPALELPAFSGWCVAPLVDAPPKMLFPLLFVTVACGAISGFHSLVASGTTAKQVASERHLLPVGYGAMLVEGLLAVMALISVAVLSLDGYREALGSLGHVNAFAAGMAGMAVSLGIPPEQGETFVALAISAFMLTTLDTATRLTRFTWQELFMPRRGTVAPLPAIGQVLSNRIAASGIAVVLAAGMALSGTAGEIWPVFGASNQLLAALALMVVAMYLARRNKPWWLAGIPAGFMMLVCVWALVLLLRGQLAPLWRSVVGGEGGVSLAAHNTPWPLVCVAAFLLGLALVLTYRAIGGALSRPVKKEGEQTHGS
jgi:carbon starvation protein